jgi:hypothetical protein
LALPRNIRLGWIGLPMANAIAYMASSSITKKKKFYKFDTWSPSASSSWPATSSGSTWLFRFNFCLRDICPKTIWPNAFGRLCVEDFCRPIECALNDGSAKALCRRNACRPNDFLPNDLFFSQKKFVHPGADVIKLFLSVIYEFSY